MHGRFGELSAHLRATLVTSQQCRTGRKAKSHLLAGLGGPKSRADGVGQTMLFAGGEWPVHVCTNNLSAVVPQGLRAVGMKRTPVNNLASSAYHSQMVVRRSEEIQHATMMMMMMMIMLLLLLALLMIAVLW
jgi:hypothetical protein